MTTKHICRVVVLGVFVEAVTAIAAAYGGLWIFCWVGDHLPGWIAPVGIVAIPILGTLGMLWDNRHSVDVGGKQV